MMFVKPFIKACSSSSTSYKGKEKEVWIEPKWIKAPTYDDYFNALVVIINWEITHFKHIFYQLSYDVNPFLKKYSYYKTNTFQLKLDLIHLQNIIFKAKTLNICDNKTYIEFTDKLSL